MLSSLACIFVFGLAAGWCFGKLKLPPLLGMLAAGIVLGPHAADLLSESLLNIAPDLRKIALVIILFRVGIALDLTDLKKVGRPALLMSFIPATLEILGVALAAVWLLQLSWVEGALLGAVLGAVSPAVVVPGMLKLLDRGHGKRKSIPQLLMAAGSVDNIYVILLFGSLLAAAAGGALGPLDALTLPLSVISGIILGALTAKILVTVFKRWHLRDTAKTLIIFSIAFWLLALESRNWFPFSGLLAVMCIGLVIRKDAPELAGQLTGKFAKLWVGAELVLFVLVGASVDLRYVAAAGLPILLVILIGLGFRTAGVWASLAKSRLNYLEKVFCVLAYLPKATVQAAIGSVALAVGLPCGQTVLTAAVISILITAPLGAIAIDMTGAKLLKGDR